MDLGPSSMDLEPSSMDLEPSSMHLGQVPHNKDYPAYLVAGFT